MQAHPDQESEMTDKQTGEQTDLLTLAVRRVYREQVEGKNGDDEPAAPTKRVERESEDR